MPRSTTALLVCSLLAPAGAATADVLLRADRQAGVVRTGEFDDESKQIISLNERVFPGAFGEADPLQPNFSDEPGFRAVEGEFNEGDSFGVNITDAVRLWDPVAHNFDGLSPFAMTLEFGGLTTTSPASLGGFTPAGFTIVVEPDGSLHSHMGITLDAPADGSVTGIYLLQLSAFATGLNASDNFWFVMNRGADEAQAALATQFVRDHVPAPGLAAWAALAAAPGLRRRRG